MTRKEEEQRTASDEINTATLISAKMGIEDMHDLCMQNP